MKAIASPRWTTALLFGAAAAAWVVTAQRMRGMDAGPGTDLGDLGWYLGVWVTMTAAMMLPSLAPLVVRVARGLPTAVFVAGYLAVWVGYGLVAYGLFRLVTSLDLGWLAWDRAGSYVAGGVVVAAGLYELTPLKRALLRGCRTPAHSTSEVALRAGVANGLGCVGCCLGLMAVLFALGVMSVLWMAVVAAVIFAEKVLPHGLGVARAVAVGLVALGLWVAASPGSVPGLTEPQPMEMEMAR
jgi:predicted metal-binding membrane protein